MGQCSALNQQFLVASVVGVQTLKAATVDVQDLIQRRYARDVLSKRHPICQQDDNGDCPLPGSLGSQDGELTVGALISF
jgi:hypothetical protein